MTPQELQADFEASRGDIKTRFETANQKLRDQNVSSLLAGAKGDPQFNTMSDAEIAEQMARDNQAAQAAQAEVRMRATGAQTVQNRDQASAGGQPAFVATDPEAPLPSPNPDPSPNVVGFKTPIKEGPRRARPGEVIDAPAFLKPEQYAVPVSPVGPGISAAASQKYRDPTEAMAAARLLGLQPAREAQAPMRVDPNTDPLYRPQPVSVPINQEEADLDRVRPEPERFLGPEPPLEIPDLHGLVMEICETLGKKAAAKYFQTTELIVTKWQKGEIQPGIKHLQILLADPEMRSVPEVKTAVRLLLKCDIETGDYMVSTDKPKLPVMMGICVKGDIPPAVVYAWLSLAKRWDVNFSIKADTLLIRARNSIVDQFLDTANQYLLFLDSDVIPPIGDPRWFLDVTKWQQGRQSFAAYDLIPRLLHHSKELVGGVYAGRAIGMPMIIQPDLSPRPGTSDKEVANRIRKGQGRGLVEVDWLATGCMLIHRKVFEGIRKRFPNLAPRTVGHGEPWGWFNPEHSEGEDYAFCQRAKKSGFKCMLDQELILGHIGRVAYGLEHTGPVRLQSL